MTVSVVPEGYVPETKYLIVLDELRETEKRLNMWQVVAATRKDKYLSLKEQNEDLSKTLIRMRARGIVDTSANGFDEARYRKVCRLLEEAIMTMADWGCDGPQDRTV